MRMCSMVTVSRLTRSSLLVHCGHGGLDPTSNLLEPGMRTTGMRGNACRELSAVGRLYATSRYSSERLNSNKGDQFGGFGIWFFFVHCLFLVDFSCSRISLLSPLVSIRSVPQFPEQFVRRLQCFVSKMDCTV
jgi:hypothetical protein